MITTLKAKRVLKAFKGFLAHLEAAVPGLLLKGLEDALLVAVQPPAQHALRLQRPQCAVRGVQGGQVELHAAAHVPRLEINRNEVNLVRSVAFSRLRPPKP